MLAKLKRAAAPLIAMLILLAFWLGMEVEHRQHSRMESDRHYHHRESAKRAE
jgi:hypothetical protein